MRQLAVLFVISLLSVIVAQAVVAQDDAAPQEASDTRDAAVDDTGEADANEPDEAPDAIETDDESYRDIDDKDFTPSEEVGADQSITFPTDI